MPHPNVGTAVPKKHRKGWSGTSSSERTRKSAPRASKQSRVPGRVVAPAPSTKGDAFRTRVFISDVFPPLRGY